jgi:hypothetical protein
VPRESLTRGQMGKKNSANAGRIGRSSRTTSFRSTGGRTMQGGITISQDLHRGSLALGSVGTRRLAHAPPRISARPPSPRLVMHEPCPSFACKVRDEDGHRCHAARRPTKRRESGGAQTGGGAGMGASLSFTLFSFFSTLEQSLLHVGVGEADVQAVPVGMRHWRSDGRSSCCAWIFRDWMRKLVCASSAVVVSPLFLRRSSVRFDGRVVLPVVRCVTGGRSSSEAESCC